jgi:V-type H+-transporting ATPase subunit a
MKKSAEENGFGVILELRFLFALMGFFAFFAGWIYNDFASIPINIFGSCFTKVPNSL